MHEGPVTSENTLAGSPGRAGVSPDDDRLNALAEFAAGAGHEINNPVATIVGHVQRLLRDEADPERRESLLTIGAQAYRIRDMISDVMLFARPPRPQPVRIDLAATVQQVIDRITRDEAGVQVHRNLQSVEVQADPVQVAVVVSELLKNAVQASVSPAAIGVRVGSESLDGQVWGVIEVSDAGRGLDERDRVHLFDPFYSGRQAGRGLGFGLPKCWRIVTRHGGRITCSSEPGKTSFLTHWPQSGPDPAGLEE